jgi:aryl-alcohol dehydrogenase-like predicted oxidoreductase
MEYRVLGKTGLRVSVLGFGCGNVGGLMVRGTAAEQQHAVARGLELGINYFDTAPSYGNGLSEQYLGRALKAVQATNVYVGTKFRLTAQDMGDIGGAVARSLDASLQRLGLDRVDLLQLHNHIALQRNADAGGLSVQDVLGSVVPALQTLQRQGKIRFCGITGLGETVAVHQVIASTALDTVQVCYNLLNPSAGVEVPAGFPAQNFDRLLTQAEQHQMGVIGIRVLAAGALSGVETRHPIAVPTVDPIASGPNYHTDVQRAQAFHTLLQAGHVQDLVEASLRFAVGHAAVSTVLLGYSSLEHLELAATYISRGPLPPAALTQLAATWQQMR